MLSTAQNKIVSFQLIIISINLFSSITILTENRVLLSLYAEIMLQCTFKASKLPKIEAVM